MTRRSFIVFRLAIVVLFCQCLGACTGGWDVPPRVLVFSKTNGYRHESIEAGKAALVELCYKNGIFCDTTENAALFTEENLRRYAAVVFLNTNGEVLDPRQEADFERYIQAGGGFMGVHSASATEYTWSWYGGLLGAYFKDHPAIQEVDLHPGDCTDPAVTHLACQPWRWKEELYNFRHYEPDLTVLLSVDDSTYKGGTSPDFFQKAGRTTHHPPTGGGGGGFHPLAWRHEYDGGRSFYTALGHIPEGYGDPVFRQHLLGGLLYAIGKNKPLRYDRCRTLRAPDPTRFVKTEIASALQEPMEIAQFPDGKIILIERHGQVKLFNPQTGLLNTITKLPVYSEMGDGLLGVAIDPGWERNHWIYLYYSSLRDSMNQLSRFVFRGDTLERASEKVLLNIPVGHTNCFHAAGSLIFDESGNLFLSTGDNTSPFASEGYAPIDERPGRKAFDAQRSSANTADLRGKIVRIKPLDDGTYTCPPGNLFNNAAGGGAPEIYVMGCRNPFRISYDERRKLLFWGDIGPDAGKNDPDRGPMGHDEINRARTAGNFGWPYFTGDNQAYRDYDFEAKRPGTYFDPQRPLNTSPNNSGARELPAAQPAFIWYPYGKNRDFPIAGSGGRNAMAGPVYYCDRYPESSRFPEYYDGKLIVYDWMRNWLMAVSLDSLGNFQRLEPLADSVKLSRPMDMLIDHKTGSIWLIEYGTRWYSSNDDARLSRIDFVRGNREPFAVLEADKTAGAAPCQVVFDCSKSGDFDGGKLAYDIDFGDGSDVFSLNPGRKAGKPDVVGHVFEKNGTYTVTLTVRDAEGAFSKSRQTIRVGNEAPVVRWDLGQRNRSFYSPGDTLHYRLIVQDAEDGDWQNGSIAAEAVSTSLDFLEKGLNPATLGKANAVSAPAEKYAEGKRLVEQSDCKSCHAVDRLVNGPSFQAIAQRYRSNVDFAVPSIYRKIIYGGAGNWGKSYMTPHPQIREEEAIQMALWILSLGDPPKPLQSLPLSGAYALAPARSQAAYVFRAAYRDRGAGGQPALESSATLALRPHCLEAEKCDARSAGVGNYKPFDNDTTVLNELKHDAWFVFRQADLRGVRTLSLRTGFGDKRQPYAGGRLEVHLDSPHGPLLGELVFEVKNRERMVFETQQIPIRGKPDDERLHDLYFVFKNLQNQGRGVVAVDWVRFDF